MSKKKTRLDQLLLEKSLVPTLEKAVALIMAGDVLVDDFPITKSGEMISDDAEIRIRHHEKAYVSRAARKLIHGLDYFEVNVQDKIALDVGASTGGFTQVLLERGAQKVFAVDVGTNQLDYRLRINPKVVSMEKQNARFMESSWFDIRPNFGVTDVSFISLELILPAMQRVLSPGSQIISLFKPQFEVGREFLDQGIVRDQAKAIEKLKQLTTQMESQNLVSLGTVQSPIQGSDGNIEYLVLWKIKQSV